MALLDDAGQTQIAAEGFRLLARSRPTGSAHVSRASGPGRPTMLLAKVEGTMGEAADALKRQQARRLEPRPPPPQGPSCIR